MSSPRDERDARDDERDNEAFSRLFAGVDRPRPLPADLDASLESILAGADPVTRLEGAGAARALPPDLRDRLAATMLPGPPLPRRVRTRVLRSIGGPAATTSMLFRAAAVSVALLLVAGGVAVAERGGSHPKPKTVAAAPTTTAQPTTTIEPTTQPPPPTTMTKPKAVKRAKPKEALVAYSSCDALLDQTRAKAAAEVGPYGLPGSGGGRAVMASSSAATTASATGDETAAPSAESSLTNVQEQGVDEPDILKTDGSRLFMVRGGHTLTALTTTAAGASVAGSVDLDVPFARDLLLAGDHVIVFTGGWYSGAPMAAGAASGPSSTVVVVDVHDLAAMKVVSKLSLEGTVVSSRLVNGIARVVIDSPALGPTFEYPTDDSPEAQQRATDHNKAVVAASTLDDWVPHYVLEDRTTSPVKTTTGRLCNCENALRPAVLPGFETATVLTIDPRRPTPGNGVAVQGAGRLIYASKTHLWLAGEAPYVPGTTALPASTVLHEFDITGSEEATYMASGAIPGWIKDQFSMSERDGILRVVTSLGTSSSITAVEPDGPALAPIGTISGLGEGEQVYGVRFLGPLAYVVTFKRTDPLFVIDMSNPRLPVLTGRLELPGFSSYLHPIDATHILGVGSSADDSGRVTGVQVSVFDVHDPAHPVRTANADLGKGYTAVNSDHHAFLRDPGTGVTVLPFNADQFAGAVAMTTGADGITQLGRLTHDGRPGPDQSSTTTTTTAPGQPVAAAVAYPAIQRSFVVGSVLYTVSPRGVLTSDAKTLADINWLPLG